MNIIAKNLAKLRDNRNSFNSIFKGFKLENYWNNMSGFDIVKFDEAIETPIGTSMKDFINILKMN